jgi:hypothetical protein
MSIALYLMYVYMCAMGEKDMYTIPISTFFPSSMALYAQWGRRACCHSHQQDETALISLPASGSEEGYEHGYVSEVVHVRSGKKGMFAIPISKTDQHFFPFQHGGSEECYEHGFVSEVCACAQWEEGHVRQSHQHD